MRERLPLPWTVHNNDDAYWVEDANGRPFGYVYFRNDRIVGTNRSPHMSRDMARRVAVNIAKLPGLLGRE